MAAHDGCPHQFDGMQAMSSPTLFGIPLPCLSPTPESHYTAYIERVPENKGSRLKPLSEHDIGGMHQSFLLIA
jgi:hypothetical protein